MKPLRGHLTLEKIKLSDENIKQLAERLCKNGIKN
ncbi:hypothetical protein J2810_002435 [Chryseobacterium rhizosphaerae]|nr:hypothetical protein [Chryseobacterium rhizosphaerae]